MKNKITFSVTSYQGYEGEILRILNDNRDISRTRAYMDWRYLGGRSSVAPKIFWIIANDGSRIGMCSLIFRSYWVNGKADNYAVMGDISLDSEYRGKGFGKRLFEFVNSVIDGESVPCALVIPTDAAKKSLISSGWEIKEHLIALAFLLNPYAKIYKKIRNHFISNLLKYLYQKFIWLIIDCQTLKGFKVETVDGIDESFEKFWNLFRKDNQIIGDRNIETLKWRYLNHPTERFKIVKIFYNTNLTGFIIYREINNTCFIYEFMTLDNKKVRQVLFSFIQNLLMESQQIEVIRITLNKNHPYFKAIRKAGFFIRGKETNLLIHVPVAGSVMNSYRWFVTSGDKDI